MLEAHISVQRDWEELTKDRKKNNSHTPPCGPDKVIYIEVRFTGIIKPVWRWMRIHPAACAIIVALLACSAGYALLKWTQRSAGPIAYSVQTMGDSVGTPSCCNSGTTNTEEEVVPSKQPLIPGNQDLVFSAARIAFVLFGLPIVLTIVIVLAFKKATLCKIVLIVLHPHQPFPEVDSPFTQQSRSYVFATRTLSKNARDKFFAIYDMPPDEAPVDPLLTSIRHITHPHDIKAAPKSHYIDPYSYWALIRFAFGMLLAQPGRERLRSAYFTYKGHEALLIVYLILITFIAIFPVLGFISNMDESQFPLIMAGLGFTWTILTFWHHRTLATNCANWEQRTLDAPFLSCSLFMYRNTFVQGNQGMWTYLARDDFQQPIRTFGFDFSEFQQITLTVLLAVYLTVLQLIK